MKKEKMRYLAAVLNSTALGVLALLAGGVLADYATALENRLLGFLASALPFLALVLSLFAGNMLLKEDGKRERIPFSFPSVRQMLYTGALTATALLVAAPLRLWTDKLLSLIGYSPVNDYLTMNSLTEAACCLLILYPLLSELFVRFLLQPRAEKLFSGLTFWLVSAGTYPLLFPRAQLFLPGMAVGVMLALLYIMTRNRFLCYISALFIQIAAFLYSVMLSYGVSNGAAMGYADLSGITVIFFNVAAAVSAALYCIRKKKKPRIPDIFAALLVFSVLLIVGIVLAGL